MRKKQFSLSFFYSILTHVGLFLLVLFVAYYVRRDVIEDEQGGGKGEVWVDLKAIGSGLEPVTSDQDKNKNISTEKKKNEEAKPFSEKITPKHDALKLRQKENLEKNNQHQTSDPGEDNSKTSAQESGAQPSSVGSGEGKGMGAGQGEGQGNSSASVLGIIRRKIEQSKRYPVLARSRKIQGVAVLSFAINPSGGVEKLSLVKSSGSELLDEEALSTVKRASPLPYYSLPIQISIKFSLE